MSRAATTRVTALVVLLAGLVAGGCGVPTHSDVRVEGPPADAGGIGPGGQLNPPPGPDEARDEEELVDFFLQAAATDPEDPVPAMREFLHPDIQAQWEPDTRIYVARLEGEASVTRGDTTRIDLTVRRVGALGANGIVEPVTRQDEQVTFWVTTEPAPAVEEARAGAVRYRLVDPPPFILLEDAALERHFDWRPVYFWDADGGKLVPDLRWLRRALPEIQRTQTVVDWLLAGPAPWLSGTLTAPPEDVERVDNVVSDETRSQLQIRLTAPPEGVDLRSLDAQLWWSLRPDLAQGLDVTVVINGDSRRLADNYRGNNAVPPDPPPSFAILDGQVWPYVPPDPPALPALPDDPDGGFDRAAMTADGQYAALVSTESTGEHRLTVAEADRPGEPVLTETALSASSMGQPVWLNNPSGSGLVVADGRLWQFRHGETAVERVELPDLAGPVTAVAAAPDGRRLALIAGDRLYLMSMARAGGLVSVSGLPRQVPTDATTLDGVAFLREEWVAVVGTARGQSRLFELTVDGALERELPDGGLGTPEVGSFVAYPGSPLDADDRGTILFEAGEYLWRYSYPRESVRITAAQLGGEQAGPEVEGVEPRSPFFLG